MSVRNGEIRKLSIVAVEALVYFLKNGFSYWIKLDSGD